MYRVVTTGVARQAATGSRFFSRAAIAQKSVTESVKDGIKKVDRTVSDAAVEGINKGEQAAQSLKEAAGVNSGKAQGKAEELAGKAKGAAAEAQGKAKGAAEEVKGKM